MNELLEQAASILRGMWRRRWFGIVAAWIVGVVGAVVLLRIPDRFEAHARVFVDTKTVLRPLMRDLAVEPDIEQTIGMLGRTLLTRPNVEKLIKDARLRDADATATANEQMVDSLMNSIKITSSGRDNTFNFTYRHPDPVCARTVVQQLVSLFVESDLGNKQRDSQTARGFIDEQIKGYEMRLVEAENRLKDFKLRNMGLFDGPGRDYFARMSALGEELKKQTLDLRAVEESRESLKRQLEGEDATLLPEMTTMTVATPEIDARLETQRKQLDELLRRYTDIHPDVVATRRLIVRLEEQRQQEQDTKRRALEARPRLAGGATNPVFQQLKVALSAADANIAAIRVRVSETQSQLQRLRESATRVPQAEAELAQLNRDYEVVRRNYEALVARREKASISEDVDSTRLAQFRVIEPPRTSPEPVFPNRVVLASVTLVLSLAAGGLVSFLVSQMRPTFSTTRDLRLMTRRPVLGSVTMLVSATRIRRMRLENAVFGSALLGLLALYGGWIAAMSVVTHLR